ncbi:MAG: c-type cytochrome [Flavobacteriales bacterium]|nr:c-type cytochrome [Flavobacteriales bacterium]
MKILKRVLIALLLIVAVVVVYVQLSWHKSYDEIALPDLHASTDSAVIARGKYLIFGPAHCATCHVPMDKINDVDQGAVIPLSGGWELAIPPGTFRAPNLTPDPETGIGHFSDGQLARALRHNVRANGDQLFPFMPFQDMSDADIVAIISYLRSQEPVKHEMPQTELSFLGKALTAFGVVKPTSPETEPPKTVAIEPTAAYGGYIANSIANCRGCHTERDLKTGEFTGEPFAGGFAMPADGFTEGYSFVTPNLTPDEETGVMALWTEDAFVGRIKAGRVHRTSPMPWGVFSRMDEVEIRAIYKYLKSLKPVKNQIPKTVFEPGEEIPG